MTTVADICAALAGRGVVANDESDLSRTVATLLGAAGIAFEPEVRLTSRDRIDFLVGGIGLELKVQGDVGSVIRQLNRYAGHTRIEHLLLVTTSRKLAAKVPSELGGKPVSSVCMGAGL